ncbi:MAG TPA: hypothetical protein VET51_01275 [Burkholderiales bacterium]|nr:hypothetical protein [Burkholderiales bacterium]
MRGYAGFTLLLSLAMLWGCSSTVLVPVPPRMDLKSYGTLGVVEFASNSDRTINAHATRQFQEQIQAAQPGTRFIELGNREALLAAVGGKQLDAEALRKIREKYGVAAIFLGDIVYSEPKTDVKLTDLTKLEGGVRAEIRADISSRLVETATGASVWSSSSWVRRQTGHLNVSAEHGVSAGMSKSNPREEMMPALVYHLTRDFRPSSVRQPAK